MSKKPKPEFADTWRDHSLPVGEQWAVRGGCRHENDPGRGDGGRPRWPLVRCACGAHAMGTRCSDCGRVQ